MPLSVTAALSLFLTATAPSPSAEPPSGSPSAQIDQAPAPTKEPAWSIGAGLTIGQLGLSSISSLTSTLSFGPGASAFLEYQATPRSFLVLGLSGTYQSSQSASGSIGNGRQRSLSADIGFRYLVTAPGAVVDVSVLTLVNGSLSDSASTILVDSSPRALGQSQWNVGVSGGLAVERKLVPGLFLRISTPVLHASYARGKVDDLNSNNNVQSGFAVGLQLAPRVELRLTF